MNPILKKYTQAEALFGSQSKMAHSAVFRPRKVIQTSNNSRQLVLSGLTNKRVNLPSQELKSYLQKTNTLDCTTAQTSHYCTLSPRTNQTIQSPISTILSPKNDK